MKKIGGTIAVLLAAGCALCFSGCGGSSRSLAQLSSNWYAYTGADKIQTTFIEGNSEFKKEEIVYSVKFDAPAKGSGNSYYSVNYADGTYTTTFYAVKFNFNNFDYPEELKEGYTSAVSAEGSKFADGIIAYYYKTELDLPSVTYTYGNASSEAFHDTQTTECYFLAVDDYLRPLYSRQQIKGSTPANLQASSLKETYFLTERQYTNHYSFDGNTCVTSITYGESDYMYEDKDKPTLAVINDINAAPYSTFDLTQLDVVARAMNLKTYSFTQGINLCTSGGGLASFTLNGAATALTLDKDENQNKTLIAALTSELEKNNLYKKTYRDITNEETGETTKEEVGLQAVAVEVHYNSAMSGVSQTYWFTRVDDVTKNTGRATLLKSSIPLTFNLGTLNYTLKEVRSTLWNGK